MFERLMCFYPPQICRSVVARVPLKLVALDVFFIVLAYLVARDQEARAAYAASLHDACAGLCSYTPSFSYGLFTQYFTMSGNGVTLTSPPTLDWFQVIAVVLIAINGWYFYTTYMSGRRSDATYSPHPPSDQGSLP